MMRSTNSANSELEVLNTPLPELSEDEDDLEPAYDGGAFAEDRPKWQNETDQYRASFWAVSAATALYTSKRLMVNHSYHYPLTLSTRTFTVLLFTSIISLGIEYEPSGSRSRLLRRWTIKAPKLENIMVPGWTTMIPAAAAAAASLPLLMQGLLHMPSLPVMIMLSPLAFVANRAVLFICRPQHRSTDGLLWEVCIASAALSMVLYDEYRLMVPGLVFGVPGIIAVGASRALFILASENIQGSHRFAKDKHHGFICLVAVLGLFISVPLTFMIEGPTPLCPFWSSTTLLLFLNRCSLVAAMLSGVSPVALISEDFYGATSQSSETQRPTLDILTTTCSSIMVFLGALLSNPAPFVSPLQMIAYLTATLILIACSGPNGPSSTRELFGIWPKSLLKSTSYRGGANSASQSTGITVLSTLISANVFISAWLLWISTLAAINILPPGLPAQLDKGFIPKSRFDIVVSMYDENPASVNQMLSAIKSTSLLKTLKPRVIIYSKSPTTDSRSLKNATGADIVKKLENTGREGGNYLHHIVNRWDDLAEQTMFIQAHAHNMRELIPRIDNFLVEDTGMLSLSFTGVVCDCNNCSDRWGWEDSWNVIPTLYKAVTNHECKGPVLLSYKGQFVASGRRIRGVSREIYQGLLDGVTSKSGWSHDANAVGGAVDTPDAPFFGYTIERIWSVLMQCSDMKIAALCPSLLSGWRRGGNVRDCQCLDVE